MADEADDGSGVQSGNGTYETVTYEERGAVSVLQLCRPAKKNAISAAMREEIEDGIGRFEADAEQTVLVLTGSEDSFSAGTDIGELQDRLPVTTTEAIALEGFSLPERIEAVDKPVIAMVNGLAVGGGFELALACDIRIAAADARVGFPEITLGGFPGEGGTQRLPRETNLGTALWLLLSGDLLSAEEAADHGLLQQVHPSAELEARTMDLASRIAEKDEAALVLAKKAAKMASRTEFQQGIELEGILANVLEATPERADRLDAFFGE